jgi:SEL1 protein
MLIKQISHICLCCGVAAAYYKMVAEKAEIVHSAFVEANAAYESGDKVQ